MKIGILGSRGIPNHYGGFEQFAAYLSPGLVERGAEVWVYNSHTHPFKERQWEGVNLIHCFDPEDKLGQAGQFIYDLNCINDSRRRKFDIILQLGYTSSSVWHWRLPAHARIITNMDGLEWKRSKYSKPVKSFLKYAEKLAVRSSHALVADSEAIQQYLLDSYGVPSVFIPYGAHINEPQQPDRLMEFDLLPHQYFLLIARMQPDNHIAEIIEGVMLSESPLPLIVIGNTGNVFGKELRKRYQSSKVRFLDGIFDNGVLDQLRHYCKLYFHGHSAGGTNPSLLEAMAASALVCAHDNVFNRSVLGNCAFYFSNPGDIKNLINSQLSTTNYRGMIDQNLEKIISTYNWDKVTDAYFELFEKALENR